MILQQCNQACSWFNKRKNLIRNSTDNRNDDNNDNKIYNYNDNGNDCVANYHLRVLVLTKQLTKYSERFLTLMPFFAKQS